MLLQVLEYLRQLISLPGDPVGSRINLLIIALFVLGSADVLFSIARLVWERAALRRAERHLDALGEQPLALSAPEVYARLGLHPRSLLARRVEQVLKLRAAGLADREVLHQLSVHHLAGYGAAGRFIAMTLPVVGLLGTVYGLGVAVAKTQVVISQDFDLQALKDLATVLSGTLGGMKTAFGTTLAGLLGAIPLSLGNHAVHRLQSRLANRLETFAACTLLPALEHADPTTDAAAKVFAQSLHAAAGKVHEWTEMAATAADVYHSAGNELRGAAETIAGAATTFQAGVGVLASQQQGFTQTLAETGQTLETVGTRIEQQFSDLKTFYESSSRLLDARLERMEQNAAAVTAQEADLRALVQSLHQVTGALDQRFAALLEANRKHLETALERLFASLGERHEKALAGSLETIHGKFDRLLAQHGKALGELVEGNRSSLSTLFGDHRDAFGAVSDLVSDLHHGVGTLLDGLAKGGNSHGPALPGSEAEPW